MSEMSRWMRTFLLVVVLGLVGPLGGAGAADNLERYQGRAHSYSVIRNGGWYTVKIFARAYTRTDSGFISTTGYARDGHWAARGFWIWGTTGMVRRVQLNAVVDFDTSGVTTGLTVNRAGVGAVFRLSNSTLRCYTSNSPSHSSPWYSNSSNLKHSITTQPGVDFCIAKIRNKWLTGWKRVKIESSGSVTLETAPGGTEDILVTVSVVRGLNW